MEGERKSLREKHNSWTEEGKAEREREPHRPSVPPSGAPQPEMLGSGLVAGTRALEVSSRERSRVLWRPPKGLQSGVPLDGEWSAREHRRRPGPAGEARCHCWKGKRRRGGTTIGIAFSKHMQALVWQGTTCTG